MSRTPYKREIAYEGDHPALQLMIRERLLLVKEKIL
jgi:hypothetical protein